MVRQDIIEFIKRQQTAGYNSSAIKDYLVRYGHQTKDIEEAFRFLESNTGLEDYIKSQMNLGYQKDAIKNFLLSRGYTHQIVDKALENVSPHNHLTKKTLLLIALIFFGLVAVGAVSYFVLNDSVEVATTTTTFDVIRTTTTGKGITTSSSSIGTLATTTTTRTISTTTTRSLPTTTTTIPFSPQTAPLLTILDYIRDVGPINPDEGEKFCSKVNDRYVDGCYQELAKSSDTMHYCSFIESKLKSDNCYIYFATKRKDFSACQYIQDIFLKRNCDILKESAEGTSTVSGPKISGIPDVTLDLNGDFALNLKNYVSITDVVWSISGSSKVNIEISEQIATFVPNVDWSGTEVVTFKACKDDLCDSDEVVVTVKRPGGFSISLIPEITLNKNADKTLDLTEYLSEQNPEWTIEDKPQYIININENKLYIKDLGEFIGSDIFNIEGCTESCDSQSVRVTTLQNEEFTFVIDQEPLYLTMDTPYSLFVLNDFTSIDNLEFSSIENEFVSISINQDSRVTFTPGNGWKGKTSIIFLACDSILCKNQTQEIVVI